MYDLYSFISLGETNKNASSFAFKALDNCHPQILNTKMQEGGIAKDPKRKNFEILLSPPRGGWEAEDKTFNDFFSKFQSSITFFRSKINKNGKNCLEIWAALMDMS